MTEPEILDFSPKELAVETIDQFYFTVDPRQVGDYTDLVKTLAAAGAAGRPPWPEWPPREIW